MKMSALFAAREAAQKSEAELRAAEREAQAAESAKEGLRQQIAAIDKFLENIGPADGAERAARVREESIRLLRRDIATNGFPNDLMLRSAAERLATIDAGFDSLKRLLAEMAAARRADRKKLEGELKALLRDWPDLSAEEQQRLNKSVHDAALPPDGR